MVIAGSILDELAENGGVLQRAGIGKIIKCVQAQPNSKLDKKHVNFLVVIQTMDEEPKLVPVPVRLVRAGRMQREFEEAANRRKLPHVRSIPVRKRENPDSLRHKIIQCLRAGVQLFRNGLRWIFENYKAFYQESGEIADEESESQPRHVSSKTVRRRRMEEWSGCHRFNPAWAVH